MSPFMLAALTALALDEAAQRTVDGRYIEAGTLGALRRKGLVGKVVKREQGRQKTTSPVTDAGRAFLASVAPAA